MTKYHKLWTDKEIDWKDKHYDREKHENDRVKRGFSDYDAWSFDTYIAVVIANYARWQRKNAPGYPSGISPEKWDEILRTIEKGFLNYSNDKFTTKGDRGEIEDFDKAMKLFKKYFGSFWT